MEVADFSRLCSECVCTCSRVCTHACGGQKLKSGVFPLPYFLRTGLSVDRELTSSTGLVGQQARDPAASVCPVLGPHRALEHLGLVFTKVLEVELGSSRLQGQHFRDQSSLHLRFSGVRKVSLFTCLMGDHPYICLTPLSPGITLCLSGSSLQDAYISL